MEDHHSLVGGGERNPCNYLSPGRIPVLHCRNDRDSFSFNPVGGILNLTGTATGNGPIAQLVRAADS